ncbi:MAG TPA: MFS transporter [Acidimicrobiales bacterium]
MSLWRHRDFRLLWAGQSVSELGSQVSVLAIPLVAIDRLHASAFEVGVLTAMETLPFVLVGLPAGAWVDRLRRRPVLIAADVGRAALLASIPVAAALSVLGLAQLYAVTLATGILTVFFDVAYQSYLPVLVGREQLIEGNGKLAATAAGAQVGGPAVGGLLVGAVGTAGAVVADAASYVISFASLLLIRKPEPPARAEGAARTTLRAEIAEGLHFVWREPRVRSVAFATGTSNLFSSMSLAVILVFLRRQIHLSAGHIGLLLAAGGAGGVLGAVLAGRLGARFGVGRTILVTMATWGAAQLAYPFVTRGNVDVLAIVGGLLASGGSVAYNINQVSLRQALCPLPLQGRMNATVRFMVWGTMPLGAILGGTLGSTVGLRATLWVVAIGSLTAFLWILFSPVPGVRTIPDIETLVAAETMG